MERDNDKSFRLFRPVRCLFKKKRVWILKPFFLPDVLTPHSLEDPVTSEESRDEPKTFQESYDDINVDHLLNNYQLVSTDTYAH